MLACSVGLAVLPSAYALGTNTNLWHAHGRAAVFWLMAVMLHDRSMRQPPGSRLPVLVLGWIVTTALLLTTTAVAPYRGPSLLKDVVTTSVAGGSAVRLAPDRSAEVTAARDVTMAAGFSPGTAMLDLTGDSPGYIFAIGGRALGQGWLIGGYAGSDRVAEKVLTVVGCAELSRAWILTTEQAPRRISLGVLAGQGLSLANYERIGRFRSSHTGGRGAPARHWDIDVWRPREGARHPCSGSDAEGGVGRSRK